MPRLSATRLALAALAALSAAAAAAQVPPHAPGTICFTPTFWCWAQPPGPPGQPCTCPGSTEAGQLG